MSGQQIAQVKCTRLKHQTYVLSVQLSNEDKLKYIGRTATEISEFRSKLLEEVKNSAAPNCSVPDFKSVKWYESNKDEKKRKAVEEFCQQILQLPADIKQTPTVNNFFTESAADSEDGIGKAPRKNSVIASTNVGQRRPSTQTDEPPIGQYEDLSNFQTDNVIVANNKAPISPKSPAKSPNSDQFVYSEVAKDSSYQPSAQPTVPSRTCADLSPKCEDAEAYAEVVIPSVPSESVPPASALSSSTTARIASTVSVEEETPPAVPDKNFTVSPKTTASDSNSKTTANKIPAQLKLYDESFEADKESTPQPSSATLPLTPIPPMPQTPAPSLLSSAELPEDWQTSDDPNEIQIIAISDYTSTSDNILSFSKGTLATLVIQSDASWWCIKQNNLYGWVPADYWRMLNPNGECASLSTKNSAPWFVGKLSRTECEDLLMEHGKQQYFVVRESTNLIGHFALSVKYDERVHHFPIELTADQRYYIGKHHFKTVNNVIAYYKKNALFYNDDGEGITLGSPLVVIKH